VAEPPVECLQIRLCHHGRRLHQQHPFLAHLPSLKHPTTMPPSADCRELGPTRPVARTDPVECWAEMATLGEKPERRSSSRGGARHLAAASLAPDRRRRWSSSSDEGHSKSGLLWRKKC
jgi:hypothetical protein